MKTAFLSLGVALALLTAPVSASTAETTTSVDLETLSEDQLDALVSILSGLPRQ